MSESTKQAKDETMAFSFDTSKEDVPIDYELHGGPYDGTVIRICWESFVERPPQQITFTVDPDEARGSKQDVYEFGSRDEHDDEGVPVGDPDIGYFHKP